MHHGPDIHQPRSALARAARAGSLDALRTALAEGADINVKDRFGWTALMEGCAVYRWKQPDAAAYERRLNAAAAVVDLLLRHHAAANTAADQDHGITALMLAAASGATRVVELLLAHGADPLQKDDLLLTAHHYAGFEGHAALAARLPPGGPRYPDGAIVPRETCPNCRTLKAHDGTAWRDARDTNPDSLCHPPYFLRLLDQVFAAPEVRFDDDEYHQDTLYRCPACRSFYRNRSVDDRFDRWAPRAYSECTLVTVSGARWFLKDKGRADLAEGLDS